MQQENYSDLKALISAPAHHDFRIARIPTSTPRSRLRCMAGKNMLLEVDPGRTTEGELKKALQQSRALAHFSISSASLRKEFTSLNFSTFDTASPSQNANANANGTSFGVEIFLSPRSPGSRLLPPLSQGCCAVSTMISSVQEHDLTSTFASEPTRE